MPGLSLSLTAATRARTIVLAIATIVLLSVWAPSAAHASGCENTFTNTAGGSWFETANWSKKALPTSSEEVCITEPGTYTVTMNQTSNVTVKALTIGAASGTQTLSEASTCSVNAVLTTTAGLTIGADGVLTMTNSATCGNNVTLVGTVNNAGTLNVEKDLGGVRSIQGNVTNTGTINVNLTTSYNGAKATLTNEGAVNVATGQALVVSEEASFVNGGGGKIAATGTGDVAVEPKASFTEGAGTTSGTKPVVVRNAALHYTGSGASLITQHGSSGTLSGNISSGQSLVLESTNSENESTTAASGFSSAGTITLTNSETNGNNAALVISSGTLASSGSIDVEKVNGGVRSIQGNVTNTGTINVNLTLSYNGAKATLTNEGAIDLATGQALAVTNEGAVVNGTSGSINATGTGDVAVEPGASFTEGAGTTSGTKPVVVRDAALHYTGSGASLITQHGTSGTLSGNISSGQSLVLESTNGENEQTTAAASFSSAGTITLTNSETNANGATLVISSGTLSSSGAIDVEKVNGGVRSIQGSVTNTGTIAVNLSLAYNGSKATLTNEGAIDVAAGQALAVTNEGAVVNGTGGSINATGTGDVAVEPGASFTEGAGTTSGTKPVVVRDAALHYAGSGSSLITQHGSSGTLSGNLSSGQSLVLESTNGENTTTTAAVGFSSAGTITLTNSETNANNAILILTTGTLVNSGTITTEQAVGGVRSIQGSVTNTGTIAINANSQFNGSKVLLTNEGTLDVAEGKQLLVSGESNVTNAAGNIAGGATGDVQLEPGSTFTEGAGTTTGTKPVIVRDGAVAYTGTGSSTIAQHGSGGTLSGNIAVGQKLILESTNGENTKTAASASFTSAGTIVMTNFETSANNVQLALGTKTLTNKSTGVIDIENPHGGVREIEAALKEEGLLSVAAGETLKVTGTYTQTGLGTLESRIASPTSFGAVAVTGKAKLAGALDVVEVEPFEGKAGESFKVLTSPTLTAKFTDLDGVTTKTPGRYYAPTYSATAATITDTQAVLTATPTEGAAGSKVLLKGTGFLPADKVKLTFTDIKKLKNVFATATVGPTGEFSEEVTLSTKDKEGAGTFTGTATTVTGLVVTTGFTVT